MILKSDLSFLQQHAGIAPSDVQMNDEDRGYQVRWSFVRPPSSDYLGSTIAVRLDRLLDRALTAVSVSVTLSLCDPSRLCVLSWHFGRRGAGHRGCGAFTTRIHASRGVP